MLVTANRMKGELHTPPKGKVELFFSFHAHPPKEGTTS
jgi:hypothetical protein